MSFLVVDRECVPILGLEPCKSLNLINLFKTYIIGKKLVSVWFFRLLWEKGTLGYTHHIEIKENFTPAFTPVQRISPALKPKVEKELKLWQTGSVN